LLGLAAALIHDAWWANPNPRLEEYLLPSSGPYEIVAVAVIAAGFGLGFWWFVGRVGGAELALGFLGVCCVLSALLVLVLPGTEYVFALLSAIAVAVCLWLVLQPRMSGLVLLIPAVVTAILVAPLVWNSYFPAGVANLPLPAFLDALAVGALIAPAVFVIPSELTAASPTCRTSPSREAHVNVTRTELDLRD
jgi:hypothetical protein